MMRQMTIKRAVKRSAGWAANCWQHVSAPATSSSVSILMYHRVASIDFVDPVLDDWNVSPEVFERQIATLADFAEIVPLASIESRLSEERKTQKPLVALTFDDGYANFFTEAVPVLQQYNAPATVFVVTDSVGKTGPLGFDAWSKKHQEDVAEDVCRSMNWGEVEACLDSGVVTVGSHSHRHLKGTECSAQQLHDEAALSREVLAERLGAENATMYAYPYGCTRLGFVTPEYVGAVREQFSLAVCTDLGVATAESDSFLLPRIEAHALDDPGVIRAKATGTLAPYYLVERLRRKKRAI